MLIPLILKIFLVFEHSLCFSHHQQIKNNLWVKEVNNLANCRYPKVLGRNTYIGAQLQSRHCIKGGNSLNAKPYVLEGGANQMAYKIIDGC